MTELIPGRGRIFFFATTVSRQALGSTQLSIQCVLEHDAGDLSPSRADVAVPPLPDMSSWHVT